MVGFLIRLFNSNNPSIALASTSFSKPAFSTSLEEDPYEPLFALDVIKKNPDCSAIP
ncbi:MAG: hypothetical protein Q8S14_09105 [Algoriphagus sp.]|uniref:hypothetical protein n=1 Tax=Algoriphagus sp. TaxID=1872435 RepID=UPI0027323AA9|nr:hypothetical protein [Algoriphagus sp.]MDP3472017.1 hypothetical protein [Algoriphagus sp.]